MSQQSIVSRIEEICKEFDGRADEVGLPIARLELAKAFAECEATLTSAMHSDGVGRCECGEMLGNKCPKCQRLLDSVTRRR